MTAPSAPRSPSRMRGYIYETCLRAGTFLVDWLTRELFASGAASKALISDCLGGGGGGEPDRRRTASSWCRTGRAA